MHLHTFIANWKESQKASLENQKLPQFLQRKYVPPFLAGNSLRRSVVQVRQVFFVAELRRSRRMVVVSTYTSSVTGIHQSQQQLLVARQLDTAVSKAH